jgi:hypothetical protein
MTDKLEDPFGSVDVETVSRSMRLPPDVDGCVWMLNLMEYEPVADCDDAGGPAKSGKEADDAHGPTAILDDLGATVPLFGDVTRQVAGDVAWERIGIVRHPSRALFFAMQNRTDFRKQYVHEQAGMETKILMGCVPLAVADPAAAGDGPLVMRARRFGEGAAPGPDPIGVTPVAHLAVDGVILGDGRRWDDVRFDWVGDGVLDVLADTVGLTDQVVVVIDPLLESLIDSVQTAGK